MLGGVGDPNPGLDDEFELFPKPLLLLFPKPLLLLPKLLLLFVPNALPVLLPLPFCPFPLRFGAPWPNPCS